MWLLALLKGSTSVAAYMAAYKLYDTALLPATAIATAAVAAAGRDLLHNARPTARRLATRSAAVAAPIALVVALISPLLLRTVFGHHYRSATSAVVLLMAASVPGAALIAITPIAILCQRELIVKWAVGGLAANIVGNVALVPVFGVPGAALAFLVTEAVLLIAFYVTLPRPRPTAMGTASPVVAPAA